MMISESRQRTSSIRTDTCKIDFYERYDGRILCSHHKTMRHNVCPLHDHRKLRTFAVIVHWLQYCYCCWSHCFVVCPPLYFDHWELEDRHLKMKYETKAAIRKIKHITIYFKQIFFFWFRHEKHKDDKSKTYGEIVRHLFRCESQTQSMWPTAVVGGKSIYFLWLISTFAVIYLFYLVCFFSFFWFNFEVFLLLDEIHFRLGIYVRDWLFINFLAFYEIYF